MRWRCNVVFGPFQSPHHAITANMLGTFSSPRSAAYRLHIWSYAHLRSLVPRLVELVLRFNRGLKRCVPLGHSCFATPASSLRRLYIDGYIVNDDDIDVSKDWSDFAQSCPSLE